MSVFAFDYLPNGKYSNLFNVAFSSKSFSDKTYLLTFPDDIAENLAASLSKSY